MLVCLQQLFCVLCLDTYCYCTLYFNYFCTYIAVQYNLNVQLVHLQLLIHRLTMQSKVCQSVLVSDVLSRPWSWSRNKSFGLNLGLEEKLLVLVLMNRRDFHQRTRLRSSNGVIFISRLWSNANSFTLTFDDQVKQLGTLSIVSGTCSK